MACFEQVAKVIGVANAKRELFVAANGYDNKMTTFYADVRLFSSFIWEDTPQDGDFWNMIDDGINPYNQ